MTLPAISYLKAHLPGTQPLGVHTLEKLADFWACVPGVKVVVTPKTLWATQKILRAGSWSAALVFPNSIRSGLEPWLAGIPRRVGAGQLIRSWCLTEVAPPMPVSMGWRHQAWHYLKLAAHFLGKEMPESLELPRLTLGGNEMGWKQTKDYAAVCPGAEYGPAKRWPVDRFAAVVRALRQSWGLRPVLLGAAGDRVVAQEVLKHVGQDLDCLDLTGKTSLREFLAWVAGARLVVANDSGSMHVAAAFGRPAVAIFGSTEPALTGPLHPAVRVVREHVSCSPCFLRECPLDFRCMKRVEVERVLEEIRRALGSPAS